MFVASGAYIAAVFLVHDSRGGRRAEDVEAHFRRCALGAAVVAGALAVAGVFALRADARFVYDGLTGPGLPLVIASGLAGLGALALLARGAGDRLRVAGAAAPRRRAPWRWWSGAGASAQHPYLLPPEGGSDGLTIDAGGGAGPDAWSRS